MRLQAQEHCKRPSAAHNAFKRSADCNRPMRTYVAPYCSTDCSERVHPIEIGSCTCRRRRTLANTPLRYFTVRLAVSSQKLIRDRHRGNPPSEPPFSIRLHANAHSGLPQTRHSVAQWYSRVYPCAYHRSTGGCNWKPSHLMPSIKLVVRIAATVAFKGLCISGLCK